MGNTSTKPAKTHPTSLPPKKNGLFSRWENRFQDSNKIDQISGQNNGTSESLQEARKRREQKQAERNGLLVEGGSHLGEAGVGLGQLLSTPASTDPSGGGHSAGASACGGGSSGGGGGGGGGHSSSGGGSGCGGGGGGGGGGGC
ncbi:hypothetical protein L486_07549 [Kwoniella mangroviensis CBS 10435]|uniref:Uncharacterized protein n=1 Tax=Kwoniella mangroviensis CBS 10435 TaxID=1331196 RepID=A0A1B9IHD1_9TREE|nr:hypothetical protein L486_07549 [Kwoniella mangroviensis CBS 10435]